VLDAALTGVELTAPERRFLARLSQWDKRAVTTVASLLWRARQLGRREATLTATQLDVVRAALLDALEYRTSGAAPAGCWDCASRASGLCSEHAKDADRARCFADLAASLGGNRDRGTAPGDGHAGARPRESRRAEFARTAVS
jgi:hypothetical protein